jgi:type IV fimbrial biogenesis protein FimT
MGMSEMTRNGGFTLLELIITIVVLIVLMGFGVPSYLEVIDRNAATGTANDLLTSILRARSEAVKTEIQVNVKRLGSDWSRWQVFTDENKNDTYDNPPDLLIEDISHDGPVPASNGNISNIISFSPRGRSVASLTEASDYFQITQGNHTRYICFSPTGRPRVQEGACP